MNEMEVIGKLGFATSKEIQEILKKSIRNTIKQLSKLEQHYQIKVMIFKTPKHRRKVYVKNEIYNNICKIS